MTKQSKAKAKQAAKEAATLKRLSKDIESKHNAIQALDEHLADLEVELRESDCQRVKMLGQDRFCNRYYWFERNGVPLTGRRSSAAARGRHLNGRIWVQGPDQIEQGSGKIEGEAESELQTLAFAISYADRRALEEGDTSLADSRYWGFYDNPDSMGQLLAWLDQRGIRERALARELYNQRETINATLLSLHQEAVEVEEDGPDVPRLSTRAKTYVDSTSLKRGCLAYRNYFGLETMGASHVDPPVSRGKKLGIQASMRASLNRHRKRARGDG